MIIIKLSPQSWLGVYSGLFLPLSIFAEITASLPKTVSLASIKTHFFLMSFFFKVLEIFNYASAAESFVAAAQIIKPNKILLTKSAKL